jgi:hypothetical protein
MWATLSLHHSTGLSAETLLPEEWSPVAADDWLDVVREELERPNRPGPGPAGDGDGDEAAHLLAAARAADFGEHHDLGLIAASIVRTIKWPGDTSLVSPVATQAVDLALRHVGDLSFESDQDALVHAIERGLTPPESVLIAWVRDPSFGTLGDPSGLAGDRQ